MSGKKTYGRKTAFLTKNPSRKFFVSCNFRSTAFAHILPRKTFSLDPYLCAQTVVLHKSRFWGFFTPSTSWNTWFVSIEMAVKAENRLIDQKSKVVPNDPQMVWEHFGDVFGVFDLFWVILPPSRVKNAYFGHLWRFWSISRDLLWNLACIKHIANNDFCGQPFSDRTV